jgi:hypothetical protein
MLPKIFSLLVLLVAALIDVNYVQFIINPDMQLLLGTIVIAIIVFFDAISGLILGLSLLVLYLRVYSKKYNIDIREIITGNKSSNYPMKSLVSAYITPKDLENAQSNVVDEAGYFKEVKGFRSPHNEPVYGVQGIDPVMPGYGSPFPGVSFESSSRDGGNRASGTTGSGGGRGGDGGVASSSLKH